MIYIVAIVDNIQQYFVGWEGLIPIFNVDKYIAQSFNNINKATKELKHIEYAIKIYNLKYKYVNLIKDNNKELIL